MTVAAYYNEVDPFCVEWLRALIGRGLIAPGDVDDRSVELVRPDDLRGYGQCHFFAGVGAWSHALRLAGWPDDRPAWTGSCPCQPFSGAGARSEFDDARHLWPPWFALVRERRPLVVFGEQVSSKDGLAWLDHVCFDLESAAYAVGSFDACAAGVGAPHIRQRTYFVADADDDGRRELGPPRIHGDRELGNDPAGRGALGAVADSASGGRSCGPGLRDRESAGQRDDVAADRGSTCAVADAAETERGARPPRCDGAGEGRPRAEPTGRGGAGLVGDARGAGPQGFSGDGDDWPGRTVEARPASAAGPLNGFWSGARWLPCRDGFARAIEPSVEPLVAIASGGVGRDFSRVRRLARRNRVGRLRAYGNAIVAELAAEFVRTYLDVKDRP